jgi:Ca2+-binding EF-hand superfamily protein
MDEQDLDDIRALFAQCDRDHNGKIDFKEFCELVEALEGELSDEEKKLGFEIVDRDASGQIGFDEFLEWWSD